MSGSWETTCANASISAWEKRLCAIPAESRVTHTAATPSEPAQNSISAVCGSSRAWMDCSESLPGASWPPKNLSWKTRARLRSMTSKASAASLRFGKLALSFVKRNLSDFVHGFPLLFHRAQLFRGRQRPRRFLFRVLHFAHAVERLPAIQHGLHRLAPAFGLLRQRAHSIKLLQRILILPELQPQNDAAVLQHSQFAIDIFLFRVILVRIAVKEQRLF